MTDSKTYIVKIKKDDIKDIDDIEEIKKILELQIGFNIDNESILTFDNDKLNKINIKTIGKRKKNKNDEICNHCNKLVKSNSYMRVLNCGHKFHNKCINNYFSKHIYLPCPLCKCEHISSQI